MSEPASQEQIQGARAYQELLVPALFGEWAPRMADAAGVKPGSTVLDIACGTGCLTRELSARAGASGSVTGLDPNPGMLAIASSQSPGISWKQGTAESLPFEDSSFDMVLSQFGLMFFMDRPRAVSEMLRVLGRGGRVAIAVWDGLESMPAYTTEVELLERIAGEEAANALRAPFSAGDARVLAEFLRSAGAEEVTVESQAGTAHFPSVHALLESDLRGWLPIMGVNLTEDVIGAVLDEGERELSGFVTAGGELTFQTRALVASGLKPASA